ncbi:MAG TPA: ATP-binding protein, partial [Ktedonobacterales bacterium]|nr:ATP-binding protein [Ktedonobacterales bacterium]
MGVVAQPTQPVQRTWQSANQRYLMASLERVRAALERHAIRRRATTDEAAATDAAPESAAPPKMTGARPAAIQRLAELFGLSPFERDVLLLCAGIELDGRFPALCASAHGDAARPWPTFGLALAALDDPHWSALLPQSPLRRWRLVELTSGGAITTAALRIDEAVLHYLTG